MSANGGPGAEPTRGNPTVIFLHIGKTAGTTLRRILRHNFRSSEIMVVRARGRPRTETLGDFAACPRPSAHGRG